MITEYKLIEVEEEIERFTYKLNQLKEKLKKENNSVFSWGCKETAALKIASVDLSAALVELRKG